MMKIADAPLHFAPQPGAMPVAVATADSTQWSVAAQTFAQAGDRLVALWGSDRRDIGEGFVVHAAYGLNDALACVRLPLCGDAPEYPDISAHFPAALRMQRAVFDLLGLRARGAADSRPWLRHGAWPQEYFPLRRDSDGTRAFDVAQEHYAFVTVGGDGVHEIPVGPIHAGIIEPGHFRFQCHGENVLHLEIELGYQHRGIERAIVAGPGQRTAHYVETLAGDTSIGHATAFALAIEALGGTTAPSRAQALRAVALEIERLANHTGDLGALANDVGYLPTASFCGRLRGDFLNATALLCGNRFGRNLVRPGGVRFDLTPQITDELSKRIETTFADTENAVNLLWQTPSVMARFEGTGTVSCHDAAAMGLVGPAARASGVSLDVRNDLPWGAYRAHHVPTVSLPAGDVCARAYVRWFEICNSVRFITEEIAALPAGAIRQETAQPAPDHLAVALVEGWRGEVCHVAITGDGGRLRHYKVADPSFHNWFGLAMALRGQQISDFPLCNKSFNLSYCGHDL